MKAIQFERVGGPEVIRVVDLPIPEPNRGEVRVKVEACGLNFSDIMIREGRYVMEVPFPYRVGREFSGRIDAVGNDVSALIKSDEVFGLSFNGGAMAEYVVVQAAAVNPVPPGVPAAEAAALQIQGINALLCVEDYGRVQEGETVVIHSAAGGVGGLAVQIALARRARVIKAVGFQKQPRGRAFSWRDDAASGATCACEFSWLASRGCDVSGSGYGRRRSHRGANFRAATQVSRKVAVLLSWGH